MIESRIKLRHLRCFLEVARRKSVVRAAESLHMTQPAVSRAIRELEETIGTTLFDRSRRGARLTERGEVFLRHAAPGMALVNQGAALAGGSITEGEIVAFGALPNVGPQFLPPVVAAFKSELRHAVLRIFSGSNVELLSRLRHGEISFVLGRLADPESMQGLAFELLYSEPLLFVVRPDHELASLASPAMADIDRFPVILPQPQTIIRAEVERFLLANAVSAFSDVIETVSTEFALAFTTANEAVWITPQGVVRNEIDAGKLVALPVGRQSLAGPVGLSYDPTRRPSMATERLLALLRLHAKEQAALS